MRTLQVARRFPRMERETRPHLAAACEVAGMLAERLGLPRSGQGVLAYRKIGVSSCAAATLFAMEHGLMAWGELPMERFGERSWRST